MPLTVLTSSHAEIAPGSQVVLDGDARIMRLFRPGQANPFLKLEQTTTKLRREGDSTILWVQGLIHHGGFCWDSIIFEAR